MARRTDHGKATAVDPRNPAPAPGELRIVQAFVNTADHVRGTDELSSPQALADWLAFHGLSETPLAHSDLERAIEVREDLRSWMAGDPEDREAGAALNAALSETLLRARFGRARELRLEPAVQDLDAALGRLLAIIATAQREGHWTRFRICAHSECRAAFYDGSTTAPRSGAATASAPGPPGDGNGRSPSEVGPLRALGVTSQAALVVMPLSIVTGQRVLVVTFGSGVTSRAALVVTFLGRLTGAWEVGDGRWALGSWGPVARSALPAGRVPCLSPWPCR